MAQYVAKKSAEDQDTTLMCRINKHPHYLGT